MENFNSKLNEKKILDFLKDNWIEILNNIYSIWINQKNRIKNILWENKVSDLIILLISYWLIKLSDNPWNKFEKEKEIKILEIDLKEIQEKLEKFWAKKIFEWRIIDTYFDTSKKELKNWIFNWWNKSSIRIRYKVPKWKESWIYYCTIKRRDKDSNESILRDCYEEEFEIFNPIVFYKLLLKIWLKEYRLKTKNRIWYVLNWDIKFDIDNYKNIPDLLEIEAKDSLVAEKYIKEFWLEKNKMLNWWSWTLFKYYWVEMKKFF